MTPQRTSPRLLLLLPILIVWLLHPLCAAGNFISHSEFWAINVAQIFGQLSSEALVLYYKSLFYLPLKTLFFLDLENWQHIQLARVLFGVFAALLSSLYLFNVWILSGRIWGVYLALAFVLGSPLYFYNIYRIRADLIANLGLWVGWTFLNLQLKKESAPLRLTRGHFTILGFVYLAILASTPKGIYFALTLFVYQSSLLLMVRSSDKATWVLPNVLSFLTPIALCSGGVVLAVAWLELAVNPYVMALKYFLTTWQDSATSGFFTHIWTNLKINFLHLGACVFGSLIILRNWRSNSVQMRASFLATLTALLIIGFHPERWTYFLAQWVPLFGLLTIPLVKCFASRKIQILLVLSLLLSPLLVTNHYSWFRSNRAQRRAIENLELLVSASPQPTYYDGTGLLPRVPSLYTFLGPNDLDSRRFTLNRLQQHPPQFIFYTPKLDIAQPDILIFLYENYAKVQDEVWLRKDLNLQFPQGLLQERLNLSSLFIYDYSPYLRF